MKARKSSIRSPSLKWPSSSQKSSKGPRMGKITRHGGPKINVKK